MPPSTAEARRRPWRRLLRVGAALGLVLSLAFAYWAWVDREWAGLPPSSLAQAALARELPPGLDALAGLLPPRAAPALDVSGLPAWQPPARSATPPTRRPSDVVELAQALAQAQPGDVIEVPAGDWRVDRTLVSGHAGTADAPIVLRGAAGARLHSRVVEAIKLFHPYWRLEHLEVLGRCEPAERCEHALHIVGQAHHVQLVGLQLRNFNAAIKVNGEGGAWPDHGRLAHSLLVNDAPRPGEAPVTAFDLVGAAFWRVEDNQILGAAKRGGNRIAYGAFMKGGGQGGRLERNLVVCAQRPEFTGLGQQVGLSFGGGTTDRDSHRDRQTGLEHVQGAAIDNIVLNCNDTALDVNESAGIELRGNLLLGSGGLLVRGRGASAEATDNRSSRPWYALPGNELRASGNRRLTPETSDARRELERLAPHSGR